MSTKFAAGVRTFCQISLRQFFGCIQKSIKWKKNKQSNEAPLYLLRTNIHHFTANNKSFYIYMRNQILFMEKQPFGRCVCTISVLSSYQIEFLVKLENLYANSSNWTHKTEMRANVCQCVVFKMFNVPYHECTFKKLQVMNDDFSALRCFPLKQVQKSFFRCFF